MSEEIIILKCKRCGTKTITKKMDSFGNPIKEVLCWNCISNDIEEKNASRYLQMAKEKDRKALRRVGKQKHNYKGLMEGVFKKLPKKFTTADIFEAYLSTKKDLGEAVIRDQKTKIGIVYNYAKYWLRFKRVRKIGKGRGSYYEKI